MIIQMPFGPVDTDLLTNQCSYLIDTCDLESNREYVEAYTGIINLLEAICDYAEAQE